MVAGWYRRACDMASAERLREESPGYLIRGDCGRWNAVHLRSGSVIGPERTLRRLAAAIDWDRWGRHVTTAGGIAIRVRQQ